MATVLISGGSGYVGKHLTKVLQSNGYEVTWLSRRSDSKSKIRRYAWNYQSGQIDTEAIATADVIVHLAGANINGKRWTKKYKTEIYESRVKSAALLFETISARENNVKAFISASASGYYGYSGAEKIFTETDPPGNDFLASTCNEWEKAANKFHELNIRTVIIRTGVVLAEDSEAWKKLILPVRYGLAAALGSGRQYFSWIHLEDLCNIYLKAVTDEAIHGIYNAVAPELVTNKQLMKTLAECLKRPMWLPNIPSFAIKIIFGEIGDLLLKGNKISSRKILDTGFHFKYESVKSIFSNLQDGN